MSESSTSVTNGKTVPPARTSTKQAKRVFSSAIKKDAVKRVAKGEPVSVVAASIPVVDSVLRGWMARAGVKTSGQKAKSANAKVKKAKRSEYRRVPSKHKRYPEEAQRLGAQKVLDGESPSEVARKLGVTAVTIRDWLKKWPTGQIVDARLAKKVDQAVDKVKASALRQVKQYIDWAQADIYRALRAGDITEFSEYHQHVLSAHRLLKGFTS